MTPAAAPMYCNRGLRFCATNSLETERNRGSIQASSQVPERKAKLKTVKEKSMKRIATTLASSLILFACTAGFAAAKDMSYSGEIMDSQCAKMGSHEAMMKKEGIATENECTLGCIKMGGKFVLFNPKTKAVYQLDDQQKPMDFAGEKVKVMGTLDKETKTIHVTSIEKAS
jgi:hypothetical protein